jgi:hypothetical protein
MPRPNLGPEPWTAPSSWTATTLSLAFVVLGVAAGWLWWWGTRRRRRPSSRPLAAGRAPAAEAPMVRGAARVRAALIARFGPGWGAKTTEEIAAEPGPAAAWGPERAEQLVRFLHAADRAKFAGTGAEAAHSPEWDAWVEAFVAEAGASSTSSGR